ncbi:ERF1 [Hepatospora eriocheir]|uniref:ERF1 n=1 Tax=Hepatospora eriocheir TaxID=1081669 RepID=A0A1X0QHR3_9MICR|nr:ERF1 [Hepatospora eriocheir]
MTVFDEIQAFRQKKLLKKLRDAKGNGTSMISLLIPPKDQIPNIQKMLVDEQGSASNIKSKSNRLSVLQAVTSTANKLKTFNTIPNNGLGLFVGEILNSEGKIKKVSHAIEPIKPINTSLYMCDSKFHIEELLKLFEDETKYGIVVADGTGALFATLQGNTPDVLMTISENLPKKHSRGGQSSVRFARLRIEKRNAYIKKINEIIVSLYLTDSIPNVEGLIIAGNTYLKDEVKKTLDPRINCINTVDTNYGGKNGLNQAIELSEDVLKDVKFTKEKKVLKNFLIEVNMDTQKYCFGYKDTINALEMGAVEILIVYENVELYHEDEEFVDWIAEHYKDFGCKLVFVSDKSAEGSQFVEGFGGIDGILRYAIEVPDYDEDVLEELSSFSDDEDIF